MSNRQGRTQQNTVPLAQRSIFEDLFYFNIFYFILFFGVCVCGVCLYKHLVSVGVLTMLEDSIEPLEMG